LITVTGATGNIGRTLVDLLAAAGEAVVAVSRTPQPASAAPGVRWAEGDTANAASLAPALDGARAVFLVVPGELNSHGEAPSTLLDVVARARPERVVLVSSQVVGTRPEATSHARLAQYEAAVRACGLPFAILRPCGFSSNAFAWAETVRTQRTVYAPFGDVALPALDPADIAAVAAAALLERGPAARTYELTGPDLISPREQAEVLADALGEPVRFVEVSRDDAFAAMTRFMAPDMAEGALAVLGAPVPAEQKISPDVEAVLHRPAGSFAGWVARNLPAFR
jgi:uncharacterized protein YbjT (DUF2867 family)